MNNNKNYLIDGCLSLCNAFAYPPIWGLNVVSSHWRVMRTLFGGDIHAGLSGASFVGAPIELGRGVRLSKVYAHLMAPYVMAFSPALPGKPHPGPWKAAAGGAGFDVTAELKIPKELESTQGEAIAIARTVLFLLRLWVSPAIMLRVFSSHAFSQLSNAVDGEPLLFPYEVHSRHFPLGVAGSSFEEHHLHWVRDNWERAHELYKKSAEYALAVDAIDDGQFIRSDALILVSLWGALEGLFSPSPSELKFRVSALIAAFLEPPGPVRLELQQGTAKLYDKRSAAAHGKPKHEGTDVLATFNLLRRVLIAIIERGSVPSKEALERALFGCAEPSESAS